MRGWSASESGAAGWRCGTERMWTLKFHSYLKVVHGGWRIDRGIAIFNFRSEMKSYAPIVKSEKNNTEYLFQYLISLKSSNFQEKLNLIYLLI